MEDQAKQEQQASEQETFEEQTCHTECECSCDFEVEHLEDGYRITVRGDKEQVEKQRRVANAYVKFLREQKKARTWLPLPLRWLLRWFNCSK